MCDEPMTGRQYQQEINGLAQILRDEATAGEFGEGEEARESFQERTHEMIDGHEWIIYTGYHYEVLAHSDNDGYSVENFGAESILTDGQLNTAAMAFGAMYGDLWDALHRLNNWDPNDPNPEN